MYLLTLILGIVLLPEARTLNCYECITGPTVTCNDTTKQCSSMANQCSTARIVIYASGSKISDDTGRSCASSEDCGEHSINVGIGRLVVTRMCCTSDLCNTQPAPPEPSPSNPNGKKCFSCDGKVCNATLNCLGNENYCTSGTGDVIPMGCASKAFCSNTQTARILEAFRAELSCCQGDYCNSASSTSAGLLLLVTPLISLILN